MVLDFGKLVTSSKEGSVARAEITEGKQASIVKEKVISY